MSHSFILFFVQNLPKDKANYARPLYPLQILTNK